MSSIRVHLADSDHFSRAGIIAALSTEKDLVVENTSSNLEDVEQATALSQPDIVIFEATITGEDLQKSIKTVIQESPRTRIIVLSPRLKRTDSNAFYGAGCSAIISKSSISNQLPSVIRMVHSGYQVFAEPADGWDETARYERRAENQSIIEALSSKDQQLVSHVASGMTNSQISRSMHLSEGSIKLHLARIMDELSVTNRVQLAVIASETGLVTSADLQLA